MILIATTIRNADRIAVINNGIIAETGTHNELIKTGGIYYGLYKKQMRGEHN